MPKSSIAICTPNDFILNSTESAREKSLMKYPFGDFKLQPRRCKPGLEQNLMYGGRQIILRDLLRRDIDGNRDVVAPARGGAAGLAKHPVPQPHDQPAFLR